MQLLNVFSGWDSGCQLLGLRHLWKVHLFQHQACFLVGPVRRGMACCASVQGAQSQARLPKLQAPSIPIQTSRKFCADLAETSLVLSREILSCLAVLSFSWGSLAAGCLLRQPQRWPAAPGCLGGAVPCSLLGCPLPNYLADLCMNKQTLRKLLYKPL